MSEYNPYKKDSVAEPEFMPTGTLANRKEEQQPEQTKPARTVDKVVSIIYASALLALQAMILVFLLCGCVQFNGDGIHIVRSFNLIINIFTMTYATVYKSLIGGAMGVMCVVVVVFVIIRIVRSVRDLIGVIRNRRTVPLGCRINLHMLTPMYDKFMMSFVNVLIFTVVSNLLGASEITGMTITLMVFGGIVFVGQNALDHVYYGKSFNVVEFIVDVVKNVVMYITMMLIVGFLNKTAGKDFLYGAQKMFNGNVFGGSVNSALYALYVNIAEPLLFVVITIIMLVIIVGSLNRTFTFESDRKKKITAALVLVGVTMIAHLVCRVIIASGATSFEISLIGYWFKLISASYIPLLLFSVIMLIISISCSFTLGKARSDTKPATPPPQSFQQQI